MSTGGCQLPHKQTAISIIQAKGLQAAALYFQFSACKADVEGRIFHYICTHSGWCSSEDGKKVSLALQIINRGIRDAQLHILAVCLSHHNKPISVAIRPWQVALAQPITEERYIKGRMNRDIIINTTHLHALASLQILCEESHLSLISEVFVCAQQQSYLE